ncbi:MAG TPA: hypothetical protein VHR45_02355 [Thermoanaerobaculia bacterium]|nr:hypothetical protein [Thermoanaerobaculia bacterium]
MARGWGRLHGGPIGAALVLGGALLLGAAAPGWSQTGGVGVSLKAGTLGIGAEVTLPVAAQLAVRLGGNGFSLSRRGEAAGGNRYDARATLRTGTALLDWHPGGGAFRLTAGAAYDGTKVEGDSIPPASGFYNIGGIAVPVALVGTLHGKVDFNSLAPYAGLGWGSRPAAGGGFGGFLDLGVIFQGRPRVSLTALLPAGSPLANPALRSILDAELAREAARIESKIDRYRYYPVLALGVSYRF